MLRSAAERHSERRLRLSSLSKFVESFASKFERGRNAGSDHAARRSTDRRHVEFLLAEQNENDERRGPTTVRSESDEISSREENATHRIESDERKRRTEKSIVGEKYFGFVENAAHHQEKIFGIRRRNASDQHATRAATFGQPKIVRLSGNDHAIADFSLEKTNENRHTDEQEETQRKSNRRRTIGRSRRNETQLEFGFVQ